MTLHRPLSRRLIASLLSLSLAPALHAAPITWIGGNADWVDATGTANWTPADEPDSDDTAIFNTPNTVNLGSNNTIQALTMSAGIDLILNGNSLTVNGGLTSLTGTGTNLTVSSGSTLNADSIALTTSSQLRLSGGNITYADSGGIGVISINSTTALAGQGVVSNVDAFTGVTSVIVNNGAISAQYFGLFIPPASGTLTLNASAADARIDLDGNSGAGILNVFRNQTLAINIPVLDGDDFDGDINLFQNASLNIANPWALGAGTLDVSNGFNSFLTPAGTAFIKGGAFSQNGGTITLATHDSTLQFDAPFTLTAGSLVNNGEVIFNANTTIAAAANFTMPASTSSLTVAAGITVNLNQTNFNLDGNGLPSNVVTVNANGRLLLNSGAGADTGLTGAVVLNGGSLSLTNTTVAWSVTGTVTTGAGTGVSVISGDPLTSFGTFAIATGSTLALTNALTFSGGSYTGAGELVFDGTVSVPSATTLNMTGGVVDLDGRATDIIGNTISVTAPLTINAATLRSFGKNNFAGTNLLFIDNSSGTGVLTVNLDSPTATWTLNSLGALTFLNDAAAATLLAGNFATLRGTVTVNGDVRTTAPVALAGALNIIAAGEPFRLGGGDLATTTNLISGGTVSGTGLLGADSGRALRGFGTINTDIDFDGSSELTAENGTLTLTGAIIDVGTIGTSAADGVLNITNAWTSNVASSVILLGGTLTGATATINNALGLTGKGLVLAEVSNETRLEANLPAGTLTIDGTTNSTDFDGNNEVGILAASNGGTLVLKDSGAFSFDGTISASGGTVFSNGFALPFSTATIVTVANGGIYHATENVTLRGTVNAGLGLPSELQVDPGKTLEFAATSNTSLFGSLRLNSSNTIIRANATFSGAGTLFNLSGSTLNPDVGATVNVLVQNAGILNIAGASAVGRVDFKDFQQDATGSLRLQLSGTGLAAFDRLIVSGGAQLAGDLNVSLTGGFFPSLGNTFNILSATAGVSGTFASTTSNASINLAAAPVLNLFATFTPTYNPTLVTLTASAITYEVQSGAYPQNFTGSGWGLLKTTAGIATLSGNLTHTGPTTVQTGTLVLSPSNNQTASLSVLAGATAVLSGSANAFTRPATLTGGPGAWTSKLDLANSSLVITTVDAGDKTTKLNTAQNQVAFGIPGVNGITSSSALADPIHKAVYVVDNALLGLTTFNGEPVTTLSILVEATYKGDTNLDRKVNVTDLGVLATFYGQNVGNFGIVHGDFNGDGLVNVSDLGILATDYGLGTAPGTPFTLESDLAAFGFAAPAAAVPEPTSLAALLLAAPLLLRRRSSQQSK